MITLSLRKLAWLAAATLALSSIAAPPAYSNGLQRFFAKPATVKVYCGYNTIGGALLRHPLRALVIVVKGTCEEDVRIVRNRVTLVAESPQVDGVVGQAIDGAAIEIAGAQNIVIDGLRVRSAPGNDSAGVFVTGNGEATIQNALIDDSGYGIWARHGGFFLLKSSEIRESRSYGILLSDAADTRVESSIVEASNSDTFSAAAIGAFRSINIRLRGANQIRNNGDDGIAGNDDDGLSLSLFHNVEIRQDGGHTVFTGAMEIGNLSHGSLRDPEIIGGVDLFGGSRMDIRPSNTGSKELTGGHRLGVFGNSQLELRSNTTVEVARIEVHEHSSLDLRNGVNVSVTEDANLDNSTLGVGNFSNVTIDQNMFLGRTGMHMGQGSHVFVGGDLGAFSRVDAGVGPNAHLEVAGTMAGNGFLNLNIDQHSTLTVANGLHISDFSLMFAGDFATINADMNFGGSVTKVNFVGDDVTYTGNMQFSPESNMTFGPNNTVIGSIDCNGGDFAAGPGFDHSGATIMNCLSWP